MAIVSSIIESSTSRHVVERHTDHLGQVYTLTWMVDGTVDPQTVLAAHASGLEDQLASSEIDTVLDND